MVANILDLMHSLLFSITQVDPIWARLNSSMDCLLDLNLTVITTPIRHSLNKNELRRAIAWDNCADFRANGSEAERVLQSIISRLALISASTSLPLSHQNCCPTWPTFKAILNWTRASPLQDSTKLVLWEALGLTG